MKYNIVIIFTIGFLSIATSQTDSTFSFDKYSVTNGDLLTNKYVNDTIADALVIYEYGKTFVDEKTFDLTFEFKQKLKILTANGLDKANITINLYNDGNQKERVKDIIATTYNLENGVTNTSKLDMNNVFEEKYNKNYTLVKFALPNVKAGTVITYSYKKTSPFMFKYQPWYFQDNIPKLHSEYNTSIPANYEYNIKLVGAQKLEVNTSKLLKQCLSTNLGIADCIVSSYVMRNIPAFIDEKFMTTRDNYLSRIEYELKIFKGFDGGVKNYTKTWGIVDKELKKEPSIGKQLKKGNLVKELLNVHIIEEKNKLTKAEAILTYVQNNYIWNEKNNIFKDVSIKDLIKSKIGNTAQINLLLYNLLKENGIDVIPIILSTRNNGLPTKIYPVISDFNYILIQATIENKTYLLDATNKYAEFGQIPYRCLNQYGRLLDFKNGSKWIDIEAAQASTNLNIIELDLLENSIIKGKFTRLSKGYPALSLKSDYFKNPKTYLSNYRNEYPELDIVEHNVLTEKKNVTTFKEEFNLELNAEVIGDKTYINPFLFVFFDENPFNLQDRTYPIDFGYQDAYQYSVKIKLNGKYNIVELPKETTKQLPENSGKLIFNIIENNGDIIVYFKYDFKKPIYHAEYYTFLKSYLKTIVNIEKNTLIVLKKK